jgi:phenylpropionate dioxygenase-like ring-hydroxylating dioxygenase large terminal subunit
VLKKEVNDLLCRVGPGTPMGELMRQYWLPVAYTWEIEPDGFPIRVRVLGEDLVAWRDSSGRPSFLAEACPHRTVSLYYGRNEENGLRCVYHGWKFDHAGNCVEMPNEPAASTFKNKVKANAYQAADFGGITWIYMGPRQANPPGVPQFEWGLLPEEHVRHSHKLVYECNWMQALEGELDSTHVYFLHRRLRPEISAKYGAWVDDVAARLHTVDTDYGMMYGAERTEEGGQDVYWRTTHFLFPMYGMFPGGSDDGTVPLSIYLPVDDEHTIHFGVSWHPARRQEGDRRPSSTLPDEPGVLGRGVGPMKPEQTGKFFANWWPEVNRENDFMMDKETRRSKNYTGIPGIRLQDSAVIWSMGAVMDREKEHLGTADAALIRVRRRLIAAAEALRDRGTIPPGVDEPELYKLRSCLTVLPPDANWQEALADWHHCRTTQHPNPGFMGRRQTLEQGAAYAGDRRNT